MGGQSSKDLKKKLQGRPTVVIVGGGYAGTAAAKALDDAFNVVLLDRRSYQMHNLASLRAVVQPNWANNILIPYDNLLKNGHVLKAEVEKITPEALYVHGVPDPVKFDYCIVATGTSYAFPAKIGIQDASEAKSLYVQANEDMKQAKRVLIVGSGPVGIELAGEIKDIFPQKKVTVVGSSDKVVSDSLTDKFRACATKKLTENGIDLVLGKRVNLDGESAELRHKAQSRYITGTRKYKLGQGEGEEIEADIAFFCTGAKVNQASFKDTLEVNTLGQVKVNEFLQSKTDSKIFAIGDCGDVDETKLGYFAGMQGEHVAKNIRALDAGKSMKPYKSGGKNVMFLPVGARRGVVELGGHVINSDLIARNMKSKELFSPKYWKLSGSKYPHGAEFELKASTRDDVKRIQAELVELELPSEIVHAANKAVEEGQEYT